MDVLQQPTSAHAPSTGLCACGCGQPTSLATKTNRRLGHVRGQPVRFRRGHHGRKPDYRVEGDCWIWAKSFIKGYGQVKINRQMRLAHRLYYERAYGRIPAGAHLHHVCGEPRCVRPEHLVALSPLEHRRLSAKLSVGSVRDIRARAAAGETYAALGRAYGVSPATIGSAVRGRTWRDVSVDKPIGMSSGTRPCPRRVWETQSSRRAKARGADERQSAPQRVDASTNRRQAPSSLGSGQ